MKYKGKVVLLDNFRTLFYDYSVDIQDIVRSAVLDGVDISKYVSLCKDNPYRLDQIRLAMKENLPSSLYRISNGDVIYKIRKLYQRGVNLSGIERQLNSGSLSDEYVEYMLSWVAEGINIDSLNLAIIPKGLLETFDYGLRSGFSMTEFNNGISYSPEYIKLCLKISKDNKSVSFLLGGEYDLEVVRRLASFSKIEDKKWEELIKNIDSSIDSKRMAMLIRLVQSGVGISDLQQKGSNGDYLYPYECLIIVHSACLGKLDYKLLIKSTTDPLRMRTMADEMELKVNKKPGIRLRGY